MSILDNLGKIRQQADVLTQSAVKRTKAAASTGRIKLAVASEEDKMKKAFTELGRLYFRDYEAGTEPVLEDYQVWIDKIADAKAQIARLTEEADRVRAAAMEPVVVPAEEPAEAPEEPVPEDPEAVEVVLETEAPAEEPTVPEFVVVDEPETPQAPEIPEEPPVGTLYVDETNAEE